MRSSFPSVLALGLVLTLGLVLARSLAAVEPLPTVELAVADIHAIGHQRLADLKLAPGVEWWVELDDRLLLSGRQPGLAAARAGLSVEGLAPASRDELYFLRTAHTPGLDGLEGVRTLAAGGAWAVVAAPSAGSLEAHLRGAGHPGCARHPGLVPLVPNTVLARQAANDPPRARALFGAGVQELVDEVDADQWLADVSTLAGYNRWTRGSDILNARDWLVGRLQAIPGLAVTTESFPVGSDTGFNVIATLPGTTRPDDWYIVGAHYDAISESSSTTAPGAEDNASGCAGVLQLARILAAHPTEGTVFLICYAGEEQGLFGSRDHAADLVASGDSARVRDVLIMDMIGYTRDTDLDSLLEANAASQPLIDLFADAAAQYTSLRIVTSLNPFGSDHVPYLDRGMTALLVIENDWNQYPGYHRSSDLPANIDLAMGGETLKMNVAAMALVAGAGGSAPTPFFTDGFESGDTGAWSASVP